MRNVVPRPTAPLNDQQMWADIVSVQRSFISDDSWFKTVGLFMILSPESSSKTGLVAELRTLNAKPSC